MDIFLAVRDDQCPDDPEKFFPEECGCGVADVDGDEDGTLDCQDACPSDPEKIAVGACGCGVPDTDGDADGQIDCLEPRSPADVADVAREALALAQQLGAGSGDREMLAGELRARAAQLEAARDNEGLSTKQRRRLGAAVRTVTNLANATGRGVRGKLKKAVRALNKHLKAL